MKRALLSQANNHSFIGVCLILPSLVCENMHSFRVVRVETQQEAQQDGQICQLMLNMSNLIYNNQCRSVRGNNGETTQGCYIFGSIFKPDEVS